MKTRKLIYLALAVMLFCTNLSESIVYAEEPDVSGEESGTDVDSNGRITDADGFQIEDGRLEKYTGTDADVVIPEGVTSISDGAFAKCSSIVDVTIPEGVIRIGSSAFMDCTKLENINIPNSMKSIGNSAFRDCSSLVSIRIPDGMEDIWGYTFYGCSSLEEIVIPESISNFREQAFEDTKWLDNKRKQDPLVIVNNLVIDGKQCSGVVSIPDGVKSIEAEAFYDCSNLTGISIPESVTDIKFAAFRKCSSLTSVSIPKNVSSINEQVFYECSSLADINFEGDVTDIGFWSFGSCISLTDMEIPESVTKIGPGAFADCSNLKSVIIPEGVSSIGYAAFSSCSSLTDLKVDIDNPNYFSKDSILYDNESNLIYCVNGKSGEIIIPEGVKCIGISAFSCCKSITAITIPQSVIDIGDGAFEQCSNLISIGIPESVESIGSDVFCNCNENLVLTVLKDSYAETYAKENNLNYKYPGNKPEESEEPENPGTQEGEGFKYKTLEDGTLEITGYEGEDAELAIPSEIDGKRVTSIGQSAFSNESLISITIPESVVKIDHYAFDCCLYLKEIILPDSVTDMGGTVFRNCNSLKSVRLSNGLTRIEPYTFESCNSLTEIVVPENVKSIGWEAFRDCTNLSSIVIPESVEHIEEDAFKGTKWLQEQREKNPLVIVNQMLIDGQTCEGNVEIPNGVTSIEVCAFDGCSGMIGIAMPDSLKYIGECSFRNCMGLTDILIPSNVTYIGNSVFAGCSSLKNMEVDSNNSTYSSEDGILYDKEKTKLFSCLIGKKGSVIIPESVINIQSNAFSDCSGLTEIIMSEGVEFIEYGAFANCSALTGIEFPQSLNNIGDYAFYNCSGLVDVKIPKGISHIGSTAFMECSQDLVLLVVKGSYAENYAKENGISYKYQENVSGESDYEYEILEDGMLEITKYNGSDTEVVVPAEIDGRFVTSIGSDAFVYSGLKRIEIPEGVKKIEGWAFTNCFEMESIKLPESLTEIGTYAFSCCIRLKCIEIPENVVKISLGAFCDCSSLTEIAISKNVTEIGKAAFGGCSNLLGIMVDTDNENYTSQDGVLFDKNMTTLIKWPEGKRADVVFPEQTTRIEDSAFYGCSELTDIKIPEGITYIGDMAFQLCENLVSVEIPQSVTFMGGIIFDSCSSKLVLSVVKDSYAETYAKENNYSYKYLEYGTEEPENPENPNEPENPENPENPKDPENPENPENPNKPENPDNPGDQEEKGYKYKIQEDGTLEITGYEGEDTELLIPSEIDGRRVANIGDEAFYSSALVSVTIPDGVTSIGGYAFDSCRNLTNINIPDGVVSIGPNAFYSCNNLTNINIPDSVADIGEWAFFGCSSLDSVTIPSSVTSIKYCTFADSGLKSITILGNVTSIGASAFDTCRNLEKINIPESVTDIGGCAFAFCRSLERITIPESVVSMNDQIFYECSKDLILMVVKDSYAETYAKENHLNYDYLWNEPENPENPNEPENPDNPEDQEGKGYKYKTLEDGTLEITGYEGEDTELLIPSEIDGRRVASIGDWAFSDSALVSVTIPEGMIRIGEHAFDFCRNLTNINIPDGVTYIGGDAFVACTSLKSITIPGSVTSIKSGTFRVSGLQSINISEGVTDIESGAFNECYGLKSITIPGSVTHINRYNFAISGLEEIIITEGVTDIESGAFVDCFNLKSVTIPGSVTSIGEDIFNGNSTLKVVKGSYAEIYAIENNIEYSYIPGSVSLSCTHTWDISITKATMKKDGVITKTCSECGEESTTTIYAPATIKLSEDIFVYNGKSQKPTVTIKDSKGKKLSGKADYNVTYPKASKDVGQYTVAINFKGNYKGTVKRTFTIVPKGTSVSKVTPKKKGFAVKWKIQKNQTTGYEIAYSTDSKFSKKNVKDILIKKNETTSKSIGKLKAKKKYFVRIRTYKTVKGKKYYSGWSKVKSVTTKK